jgi:formylmethanofuran dehydrogenase subunit E
MEENLDYYLEKAAALHGDACAGILLGTRIALAGMKALGMDPSKRNRDLIVFVEIDRCMTDAVQAVTGKTLGHRTLKYVNYGKFAATFHDLASGRTVRVSRRPEAACQHDGTDMQQYFRTVPEEELLNIEEVKLSLDENDLPGFPKNTKECSRCGELIFDGRGVIRNGKLLCKACAEGSYYERKE